MSEKSDYTEKSKKLVAFSFIPSPTFWLPDESNHHYCIEAGDTTSVKSIDSPANVSTVTKTQLLLLARLERTDLEGFASLTRFQNNAITSH